MNYVLYVMSYCICILIGVQALCKYINWGNMFRDSLNDRKATSKHLAVIFWYLTNMVADKESQQDAVPSQQDSMWENFVIF